MVVSGRLSWVLLQLVSGRQARISINTHVGKCIVHVTLQPLTNVWHYNDLAMSCIQELVGSLRICNAVDRGHGHSSGVSAVTLSFRSPAVTIRASSEMPPTEMVGEDDEGGMDVDVDGDASDEVATDDEAVGSVSTQVVHAPTRTIPPPPPLPSSRTGTDVGSSATWTIPPSPRAPRPVAEILAEMEANIVTQDVATAIRGPWDGRPIVAAVAAATSAPPPPPPPPPPLARQQRTVAEGTLQSFRSAGIPGPPSHPPPSSEV